MIKKLSELICNSVTSCAAGNMPFLLNCSLLVLSLLSIIVLFPFWLVTLMEFHIIMPPMENILTTEMFSGDQPCQYEINFQCL
jgi:hypothetical protein